MRKCSVFIMSLMLVAFASCDKGENKTEGNVTFDDAPELPAPKFADEAVTLNFEGVEQVPYESIELTQNGTAIIKRRVESGAPTRTAVVDLYIVGNYKKVGGEIIITQLNSDVIICRFEYEFEEEGNHEVHVSLTIENEAPIECVAVAVKVETSQDDVVNKLTQKWKVVKSELTHTIKGVTISKPFRGCNINEMVDYAKTVAEFDEELKESYDVSFIEFINPSTITIAYKSKASDVGEWSWTNKDERQLSFSWVNQVSTKILKESSCKFDYDGYEKSYVLILSAHITDDKEKGDYLINLVLFVEPMQ